MTNKTIETMMTEHEAAHDAGGGSNSIAALSHAREEMYFRNKDAELIKALKAKDKAASDKKTVDKKTRAKS